MLNILRIWDFFFQHVLDLFDGCMIVHLSFSHVFGNVTGFVYVCIGFIWWVHECPPVVLVLFNGCMIVHLLFSQVFGSLLVLHDCPPVVLVLFDGCMIVQLLISHDSLRVVLILLVEAFMICHQKKNDEGKGFSAWDSKWNPPFEHIKNKIKNKK